MGITYIRMKCTDRSQRRMGMGLEKPGLPRCMDRTEWRCKTGKAELLFSAGTYWPHYYVPEHLRTFHVIILTVLLGGRQG